MTDPARRLVALRGDEEDLFREHAARLRRVVSHDVHASAEVVEDACQQAWTILMRAQPDRGPTLFAWLRTVATRQAWELAARERRTLHLEQLGTSSDEDSARGGGWETRVPGRDDLEVRLEAGDALRTLAALPERQRRYLTMRVAGLSYREIAEADGGVTLTAVNRHLVRARRSIRDARAA